MLERLDQRPRSRPVPDLHCQWDLGASFASTHPYDWDSDRQKRVETTTIARRAPAPSRAINHMSGLPLVPEVGGGGGATDRDLVGEAPALLWGVGMAVAGSGVGVAVGSGVGVAVGSGVDVAVGSGVGVSVGSGVGVGVGSGVGVGVGSGVGVGVGSGPTLMLESPPTACSTRCESRSTRRRSGDPPRWERRPYT